MISINKALSSKNFHYFIIFIMFWLLIFNISDRYMFIDESIEALIGKNILKYGYPKAWDGTNLAMAGINGNEFNEYLIPVRNNWLPYYLASIGQWVSNQIGFDVQGSVGVMRMIFSVIGVIGAFFFYKLVKELSHDQIVSNIAITLFAFSVPILLYVKSIYYLSPTLTFTITSVLYYLRYIRTHDKKFFMIFVVSSILLFHSFYPYFFITIFSLIVIYLLFDFEKETFKQLLVGAGLVTIFTLPWFLYIRLYLNSVEKNIFVSFDVFIKSLSGYLWQIHAYFFPFIPIAILAILIFCFTRFIRKEEIRNSKFCNGKIRTLYTTILTKKSSFRGLTLCITLVLTNLIVISCTVNFLDTRRIISAIPFLIVIFSYFLNYIYQHVKILGVMVIILSVFTNVFHVVPYLVAKNIDVSLVDEIIYPPLPFFDFDENWKNKKGDLHQYLEDTCKIESYMMYYLEGILHSYNDADKGMVDFLLKNAKIGQKVYLVGFQYETIAYYTGLQVTNRLDPNYDPLPTLYEIYPNATRFQHLTDYPIEQCDWIIERNINKLNYENEIWHDESKFERIYIDCPESDPWNEIWAHSFFTDKTFDGFYVYRNLSTTDPIE